MAIVTTVDGAYINQNNVVRTVLWMNNKGQIGLCGLSFKCTADSGFGVSAGEFAKVVQTGIDGPMQNLQAIDTNILGCKVSFLPPDSAQGAGIATSTSIGAQGGPALPTQVSGIVSLKTDKSGRKYRGRFYVPFPDQSAADVDSTPTAGYVSALDALRSAWIKTWNVVGASGTATLVPVIFHRGANTTDVITASLSKKLFATQRRRGDYGKLNAPVIA